MSELNLAACFLLSTLCTRILAELEEARLLALSLEQPAAAVAASMGKAKVSENIVQRHEHGKPGDFSHLNDEELKASLYDVTNG